MTLNEKVVNYKVLDLVILYNFGIKFDFIRDHIKKLWFFCVEPFVGAGHAITRPLKMDLSKWVRYYPPLQMPPFLEAVHGVTRP